MSRLSRHGVNAKRLIGGGLNKAHSLADAFQTLDTGRWSSNANASVVGWRGRLTFGAVGSGVSAFGTGATHYDLTSSSVYVQFATLPTLQTSTCYLMARVDANNYVFIGQESGNLLMREVAAGVASDTTLAWDYTFHRFVRLRHDGTSIIWETSSNGSAWTVRRTKTPAITLSNVEIRIEGQWLVTAGGGGRFEISHFNTSPVGTLSYTPPPYNFGSLQTLTTNAASEYAGGTRLAMHEIGWDAYEPTNGAFSSSYAADQVTKRNALQAAGLKLTLATGIYYPPSWVGSLSNAKYVNEFGGSSSENNFVFNQLVRTEAEQYLTRVDTDLGLNNYWAIRLTSGGNPETLYPSGGFWAYDANAQGGADRPATVSPCPYPGWVPGNTSITTAQVRDWLEWYMASLADAVNWQIRFLRGLGFTGWFEILTPGQGTRPTQWETDIANRLSPAATTTGLGAVWLKVYEKLVDRHGVVCYSSSAGDQSGVPANNVPTVADTSTSVTSSGVNDWSAMRWAVRIANEYGMPNGHENPGWGALANSYYQDTTSTGMMAQSFNQITAAKALSFYWAHSNKLWDGTLPFSNYQSKIAGANTTGAGVPPNPP